MDCCLGPIENERRVRNAVMLLFTHARDFFDFFRQRVVVAASESRQVSVGRDSRFSIRCGFPFTVSRLLSILSSNWFNVKSIIFSKHSSLCGHSENALFMGSFSLFFFIVIAKSFFFHHISREHIRSAYHGDCEAALCIGRLLGLVPRNNGILGQSRSWICGG